MLWNATKPNLPGWLETPATTMPRGSNNARKSSRVAALRRPVRATPAGCGPGPAASSTSASTATGTPPATTSGLTSTDTIDGSCSTSSDSATSVAARALRSTAGSPRNGPSNTWAPSESTMSRASSASIGTTRNATSATASASTPPTPTMTHGPNCGSVCTPAISSRDPRTIGATSNATSPSSGRAAARRSTAAAATASGVVRPSRTSPRSVLCAIVSPDSLTTTGSPSSAAAVTAASGVATRRWGATVTPACSIRDFDSNSDSVRVMIPVPRSRRCAPGRAEWRAARRSAPGTPAPSERDRSAGPARCFAGYPFRDARSRASDRAVAVAPVLVAQDALQQLARLGAW